MTVSPMQAKPGMLRPSLKPRLVARNLWSATSELNPASINVYAGVRSSLALSLPAVLGLFTSAGLGPAASLGGFETSLADTGGPYATRAQMTVTAAVAGSILFAIGSGGALKPSIALILTGAVAFCTAYLAAFGDNGRILGNVLLTFFLAGIGTRYTGSFGLRQALPCLAGGMWAVLLSIGMWPISPFGPARAALGSCYRDFSRWLKDCEYLLSRGSASSGKWEPLSRTHEQRIQGLLDRARKFVLESRYIRDSGSRRGDQMLVLVRISDSLVGEMTALSYSLSSLSQNVLNADIAFELRRIMTNIQEVLLYVAEQSTGSRRMAVPRRTLQAAQGSLMVIDEIVAKEPAQNSTDLQAVLRLVQAFLADLRVAASSAYGIEVGQPEDLQRLEERQNRFTQIRTTLQQNWSYDSLILRHALRVAIVCFFALTLSFLLGLNRGYWAPLTAAIILQPLSGLTMRRSAQRLLGTLAGALFAVLLSSTLPTHAAVVAFLVPLTFITAAVRPVSYFLYVLFLTPVFVLLAEAHPGDWHLAQVRAIDTALGCLVAVAGAWLLWPAWETPRFANALATALRANAAFLRYTLRIADGPAQNRMRGLSEIRKQAATANATAESSLQNLLQETDQPGLTMPAMELVSSLRRFAYRVNAFAPLVALEDFSRNESVVQLEQLSDRMDWLALVLTQGPENSSVPSPLLSGELPLSSRHDRRILDDQIPALEQLTEIMSNAVMALQTRLNPPSN